MLVFRSPACLNAVYTLEISATMRSIVRITSKRHPYSTILAHVQGILELSIGFCSKVWND